MATTPTHDWPTPDNTDRVADGASAIRSLGDAIDATVPIIYTETASVGTIVATGNETVTVTFPGGLFATPPTVNITPTTNFPAAASASVSDITAADCVVVITNLRTAGSITGGYCLMAVL